MKTQGSQLILALLAVLLLSVAPVRAGESAPGCSVKITHPLPGQQVSGRLKVEGTATIPSNHHLWIFARHESFRTSNEWWTQGEASLHGNSWKLDATIGEPRDIGSDFDVTAAVFDAAQLPTLLANFKENRKMVMPPVACAADVFTVSKTSD
jgi:hypothetical protein